MCIKTTVKKTEVEKIIKVDQIWSSVGLQGSANMHQQALGKKTSTGGLSKHTNNEGKQEKMFIFFCPGFSLKISHFLSPSPPPELSVITLRLHRHTQTHTHTKSMEQRW